MAAERRWLPDALIRLGIRGTCRRRLKQWDGPEAEAEQTRRFVEAARLGPIALLPERANTQHYEVPPEFFQLVLGPRLKYSCCYWESPDVSLERAEEAALLRTCENALLGNGQRVLELGCGWGSLSLFMAERYPDSEILAVSNSSSQRAYIESQVSLRRLTNLKVVTTDVNDLKPQGLFDRVVSVEMFEHVRNHALLMERVASWLKPDGYLLVHIFCSQGPPYAFEDESADDWMARHFFSGGVMPSDDLLLRYQQDLVLDQQWRWSGLHYQRTLEAWLGQLDRAWSQVGEILARSGESQPRISGQRWRIFLMACSELFGFDQGRKWWVSHYRFKPALGPRSFRQA